MADNKWRSWWSEPLNRSREYNRFVRWYNSQYGMASFPRSGLNSQNFMDSQYYEFWASVGKPATKFEVQPQIGAEYGIDPKTRWEPFVRPGTTPPSPTEDEDIQTKIVNGMRFYRTKSPDGLWSPWDNDTTYRPEEGPTQWQQEQLGLQRTELGMKSAEALNKQRYNELEARRQALEFETHRIGAQQFGRAEGANRAVQEQYARQFEDLRRELTSSTAPRDWVIKAKAGQVVNPYAPQSTQAQYQEDVDVAKQRLDTYTTMRKDRADALNKATALYLTDPSAPAYQTAMEAAKYGFTEIANKVKSTESWLEQSQGTEEAKVAAQWGAGGAWGVGIPSEPWKPPPKPALPTEMRGAFGGVKEFGEFERPSGQQWAAATWTPREQMAGYYESLSSGNAWQDVLEQMSMEQPRTPSLGRRWTPARARI